MVASSLYATSFIRVEVQVHHQDCAGKNKTQKKTTPRKSQTLGKISLERSQKPGKSTPKKPTPEKNQKLEKMTETRIQTK